jgi:hypothetical protein
LYENWKCNTSVESSRWNLLEVLTVHCYVLKEQQGLNRETHQHTKLNWTLLNLSMLKEKKLSWS